MTDIGYPKLKPYRNRKLLDGYKGEPCSLCGAPASCSHHYKGFHQHSYGGGKGIVVSDLASLYVCQYHHDLFHGVVDAGRYTRMELNDMQLHGIVLTNIRRVEQGLFKSV